MSRLEDWQLNDLCAQLEIPEAGRLRIERIRGSEPSRRVRSNGKNVCVRYPSRKMGFTIQAESHKVELVYVYQCENNDNVLEYYDQPTPIKIVYKNINGRTVGPTHTPDYFVITNNYIGYTECKTEQELERLAEKVPERYVRDKDGTWCCPPGEKAAAEVGLSYRIWSDIEINWTLYSNLIFLEDYMADDFPGVSEQQTELITKILREKKDLTLNELVTLKEVDSDAVYGLMLEERIYVDLENYRLSDSHDTHVFLNKTYAEAYGKLHSIHTNNSLYNSSGISLEPGEHIVWDGIKWRVVNVGNEQITLSSTQGKTISISQPSFHQMVSDGLILAGSNCSENVLDKLRLSIISSASERNLEKANYRLKVILPVLKGECGICDINGYSERTLYRWISKYSEAEREYGQGYLGLIPGDNNKGNRVPKLSEESENKMREIIESYYEDKKQVSVKAAYERLTLVCDRSGIIYPSEKTFRKRIKSMPKENQVRKRQGKRAASNSTLSHSFY